MKKLFCMVLALVMLLGICACGEDVRGTIGDGDTSNFDETEFSLGNAEGTTYKNDFLGLRFTLPEGWTFYTDQQILELNNLTGEYLDEDAAELLENASIIYDMYAINASNSSNVNVNLEKLSLAQMAALNLQQTLEAQLPTIRSTYANMGYTDVEASYQKVIVGGKTYDGLRLVAKINGTDFFATAFTFAKGLYLANVTVCTMQVDQTDLLLDQFTFA